MFAEPAQIGRAIQIRRLEPALATADHATGDRRQLWHSAEPVATEVLICGSKRQGRIGLRSADDGSNAVSRFAAGDNRAGTIMQIGAQTAGAPVQCDQASLVLAAHSPKVCIIGRLR